MHSKDDPRYCIITAGGKGSRMSGDVPKQFLPLRDRPVLMHTIAAFHGLVQDIVLTLPGDHIPYWKNLCTEFGFRIPHRVAEGGKSRFDSVRNGLEMIPEESGWVAVHDGVRPMVSASLIEAVFKAAKQHGNAVPYVPVTGSLRRVKANGNEPVDRNAYRIIQTPQCFESALLKRAYRQSYKPSFTDEATVAEAAGASIFLIPGESRNIKLTTPRDMELAAFYLDQG